MNYFYTILLVNSLMISCLHGMSVDAGEDRAPEFNYSFKPTCWEHEKMMIGEFIEKHRVHPDVIKCGYGNASYPLFRAITELDVPFAEYLITQKADVQNRVTGPGFDNYPLLFLVRTKEMAELLLRKGALVNAKGEKHRTLPLLCHIAQKDSDPSFIALYGQHGVDVQAVNKNGESPLHELVNSSAKPTARTIEQAQKFIEIGVPLDTQSGAGSLSWAYMTAIQWLIVRIKQDSRGEIVKEHNVQLLLVLKQALRAKVSTELSSVLTKDPTGIVLDYYDDGQTDAEIDRLVAQIAMREGYVARRGQEEILALQNGSGGSW